MSVRAIDVSRWQGRIDWQAVRADGVRAAWIKVGGADGSLYRDPRGVENIEGASAAGVVFGTYYFCAPGRWDPVGQARHAVSCGHGSGRLLPAADVESNPHRLTRAEYDRWVTEFCHEVARLTGKESVVYTYSAAGLVGYTEHAPSHCRLWIANYGSNTPSATPPARNPGLPPAWREWSVWQFNSTTRVPGIAGNSVDQNVISDRFWNEMTGAASVVPMEDEDMYHIVTDARRDSPYWGTTWMVHGFEKKFMPSTEYAELVKEKGAKENPAHFVDHGWQGDGSVWIALLDFAEVVGVGPGA